MPGFSAFLVVVPALVGFGVAVATAPAWERRLRAADWIDVPRPDRHSRRPVSRAGGAAWLSGLLAGMAASILLQVGASGAPAGRGGPGPAGALGAGIPGDSAAPFVLTGVVGVVAVLAFLLGRLDDRGRLGPGRKWLLQSALLAAGVLGLVFGPRLLGSGAPSGIAPGGVASSPGEDLGPLAVAFLTGIVLQVALEILDHLDGLLTVHAAAGAAALALAAGPGWAREVAVAGIGASIGFLCWNRPPARLYLGNAGSLAVATVLPLLLVAVALQSQGAAVRGHGAGPDLAGFLAAGAPGSGRVSAWRFAAVLPAFAWPLLDLVAVSVSRLARGDPPWKGGQDHRAHQLARRQGGSDRASFAVGAVAAAAGFLLAATGLR